MNIEKSQKIFPLYTGIIIGLCTLVSIAATADDFGWTWDEVYYFCSSQLQVEWASALAESTSIDELSHVLSRKVVDAYWLWDIDHNPHPPLYKIMSSITVTAFGELLGKKTAYRLSSALLAGIIIVLLYFILQPRYGTAAAVYGSASLLLMPRFFGHAHIAATEIPLTAFWLLCCWSFLKGLHTRTGSVLLGIFWGCALAIKFTAVLIPASLLLWSILFRERRCFRNLCCLVLIAPVFAVLVNPGWWYDPVSKISHFFHISLSREETIPVSTFFFGKVYRFSPPWHYAPVMLAVTIPATALFTILVGVIQFIKQRSSLRDDAIFLINVPVILGVVMFANAPVHDGIRQFFYVLPFCAFISAMGFYYIQQIISSSAIHNMMKKFLLSLLFCLLLGYPLLHVYNTHPHMLSYYNNLIGGLRGAWDRGMEITYWFDAVDDHFIDSLNTTVPPGATVFVWPPNTGYFKFLQQQGIVDPHLCFFNSPKFPSPHREENKKHPHYMILMMRRAVLNEHHYRIIEKCSPLAAVTHESIPLIALYKW